MKFTEGAFKNWGYEVAEQEFADKTFTWAEYDRIVEKEGKDAANKAQDEAVKEGKIIVKDAIADIFLQQILTRPNERSEERREGKDRRNRSAECKERIE